MIILYFIQRLNWKICKVHICCWNWTYWLPKDIPDPTPIQILLLLLVILRKLEENLRLLLILLVQSEGSSIPRAHSIAKGLENLQDIKFDINFEKISFQSKSLSWIDETVVDSSISFHSPVEDQFSHSQLGFQSRSQSTT